MLKIVSQISVFIAVLSQILLVKESNFLYANIISSIVVFPYILSVFSTKKNDISLPLIMYVFLSIYWIASTLWHPDGSLFNFARLRTFVVISGFLLIFTSLIKRQNCFDAVRWAFVSCIFVNFLLMVLSLNNSIFGKIYVHERFVGSFINANQAALVFFFRNYFLFL